MRQKAEYKVPARYGKVTVFIGQGSDIEGKHTFTGTVLLNGKLQGELTTTGALIVNDKGSVNGAVRAQSVLVMGEVMGHVQASERVELKPSARVFADLEAPVVVIEEGALFEGHCRVISSTPECA